jgi:dihydrofolate synthase/folylpolyglutamate synthase
MNYSQAEEYVSNLVDYEKIPHISYASPDYNLKHVEYLLQSLGKPHLHTRAVHIAGTKGKGSVAAMIAQVLTISGYNTGLYTSPHLHTFRERIRVNGNLISKAEFASLMTKLKPYVERVKRNPDYQRLTFFEVLTVLAFVYFRQKQADFQVLEVGLGGRLDATNVVKPDVCVITPVSLDHTEILGDTLGRIALEKAGIIKPGCFVISAPQAEEVSKVLNDVCHRQDAELIQVGKDIIWHSATSDLHKQSFMVGGKRGVYHITIPLLGDFQVENASTAIAALEVLSSQGFDISMENIIRGLAKVDWPGRFQVLNHKPIILVDGAHNVASMKRLVWNVRKYFHYERLFVIFGAPVDKDISGTARELASLSPRVIVTRSSHPRAASPDTISAKFDGSGIKPQVAENVCEALALALSMAKDNDLILVTGSLFVVAEALDYSAKYLEKTS